MCQGWHTNTLDTASFLILSKLFEGEVVDTLRLLVWSKLEQCFCCCCCCFFSLSVHELLQQSNGEEQKKPFWVDKEENRWYADDKPPSALENDQNLDTLQQSHNPLLQERSRRPIHTLAFLSESV